MSVGRMSFGALFKRTWNDFPELVGSGFMAFIGLGIIAGSYYMYVQKDGDNRKHKLKYTVVRSDDPRAAKARTGIDG